VINKTGSEKMKVHANCRNVETVMIDQPNGKCQKGQNVYKANDKYSTRYESREEVAGTQEKSGIIGLISQE
jgi:hypothetical protein